MTRSDTHHDRVLGLVLASISMLPAWKIRLVWLFLGLIRGRFQLPSAAGHGLNHDADRSPDLRGESVAP